MAASPLQQTDIAITIRPPMARTCITQHFKNTGKKPIEAVYQFPLPRDAALGDIGITINDKLYKGVITGKSKAEAKYEEGVSGGKRSVLVSDLGDGLYEINAGNLDAARDLQLKMISVNQAVTAIYGVPGLKTAMDMCGYFGGDPRLPLLPSSEKERSEIEAILKKADLLG